MIIYKKFFLSFILLISFSLPAYAAIGIPSDYYPVGLPTINGAVPTGASTTGVEAVRDALTSRFVNVLLAIAGIVAIFSLLNNAWFLIISAGKEETITQHKKGLMWAIVGLIFIILSFSIIRFVITVPGAANEEAKTTEQPTGEGDAKLPPGVKPIGSDLKYQPKEDRPSTEPGDFPSSSNTPQENPTQPTPAPENSPTDQQA